MPVFIPRLSLPHLISPLFLLLFFSCQSDSNITDTSENELDKWERIIRSIPNELDESQWFCPSDIPEPLSKFEGVIKKAEDLYLNSLEYPLSRDTLALLDDAVAWIDADSSRQYPHLKAKIFLIQANTIAIYRAHEEAYDKCDKGIKILSEKFPREKCDSVLLADLYNMAGICRQMLMDEDISLSLFKSAININRQLKRYKEILKDLSNLSLSYYYSGELDSAVYYQNLSESFMRNFLDTKIDTFNYMAMLNGNAMILRDKSVEHLNRGEILQFRNSLNESIKKLHHTQYILGLFPKTGETQMYHFYSNYNLATCFQIANFRTHQGDSLLFYTEQAIDAIRDMTGTRKYFGILKPFMAYGNALNGNCEPVDKLIQESLDSLFIFDQAELNMTDPYYFQAEIMRGLSYLECMDNKEDKTQGLIKSYEAIARSMDIFDHMRQNFVTAASQEGLRQKHAHHFSKIVEIAWRVSEEAKLKNDLKTQNEYLEKAFFMSERSKAFTLQQGLYNHLAEINFTGIKNELLNQELEFKQALQPNKSPQERLSIIEDYQSFINALAASKNIDSLSYYLERFDNSIPDISELRSDLIDENSALIEYQLGRDVSLAFVITEKEFEVIPISIDSTTHFHINRFKESLSAESRNYKKDAKHLYDKLLKPIVNKLPEHIRKLVIIPDKELAGLPFGSFISSDKGNWSDLPYVINKYAITYYYSLNSLQKIKLLNESRQSLQNWEPWGAFIANPRDASNSSMVCSDTPIDNIASTTQSLYSEMIQPLFPKTPKPYSVATGEDFVKNAGKFKLLQLSLHACLSDNGDPSQSFLQFFGSNGSLNHVSIADIHSLSLQAENAVLSICKSGTGPSVSGEGLKSFARAFALSGCSSIIATTTSVLDKPTATIIRYYYENLIEKQQEKHMALQNAKKRYITEHSEHPWKWGNIICIGDPAKLTFLKSN